MHLQVRGRGRRPHPALSALGLLGGTFNPPHVGHVALATCARRELRLDRVLLVPAGTPPHKEVQGDPGAAVRLALCRRAVEGVEGVDVSDVEIARPGPSYTADTLRALHARGDDLTFIVGGDMALSLPTWREPLEVLRLARLGVAERTGALRAAIEERLAPLGGEVAFFTMPPVDVSSTQVRRAVAAGEDVRGLVGAGVAEEIAARGLYR